MTITEIEEDLGQTIVCPACNAEQNVEEARLGILGNLAWFRCRHCGIQWRINYV